ncbi:MAG: phosphoribosyltransferase [Halomonas sp.]|nr:phosphoribosyltransferase [Halomonas sp.]
MTELPFANRQAAGRALAKRLEARKKDSPLVLGLPRGGVPVAAEVARALGAALDVMVVRKLGMPGHEEFALGAIASGGITVLDEPLIQRLRIDTDGLQAVIDKERRELARRELTYRGDRAYPDLRGRQVILIDDGIATGSSMRAAIQAVRQLGVRHCTLAVPVAPAETLAELADEADDIVCVATPEHFRAVGQWYVEFAQTSDDEVCTLLNDPGLRADDPAS